VLCSPICLFEPVTSPERSLPVQLHVLVAHVSLSCFSSRREPHKAAGCHALAHCNVIVFSTAYVTQEPGSRSEQVRDEANNELGLASLVVVVGTYSYVTRNPGPGQLQSSRCLTKDGSVFMGRESPQLDSSRIHSVTTISDPW